MKSEGNMTVKTYLRQNTQTIVKNVFLAQLVGLPLIGILATIVGVITGPLICIRQADDTCTHDYWSALFVLVPTIIVGIPLAFYLRGNEKLSVRISQLIWLIPAVVSGFSLIWMLIGFSSYAHFTDAINGILGYLVTIAIFGAITKSYKEFQRQRPPVAHHLIIKGIFVTQLAIITWIAASSAFGGWTCSGTINDQGMCSSIESTYDATNLASIGLLIAAGAGLIAWLRNQRSLSIRLSRLSLVALTLYVAFFYLTYSSQLLDFYRDQPGLATLNIALFLTPLTLFAFIHHFKKQIIEN